VSETASTPATRGPLARLLGPLLAGLLAIALFVGGGVYHARYVNLNIKSADQRAYVNEVDRLVESNYTRAVERNRMPLYLYVQSVFHDRGAERSENFARGKLVNVGLSAIGVLLVGGAALLCMGRLTAVAATLCAAFGVYMMRAGYYQVETTYYTLLALTFLAMGGCLLRPRWWLAILAGVLAALTHLSKAAVPPLVVGFAVLMLSAGATAWLGVWRRREMTPEARRQRWQPVWLGLFLLAFLGVLWPYISHSKQQFGSYFYNVNSTFYVWYDSWDDAKAGTRAHGDREAYPDMPPEEIPGPLKYLQTRSLADIYDRTTYGLSRITGGLKHYDGWLRLSAYFLLPTIVFLATTPKLIGRIRRQPGLLWAVLFGGGFLLGYTLLIGFYGVIAAPQRSIMALATPAMLGCAWVLDRLENRHPGLWGLRPSHVLWSIVVLLIVELPVTLLPGLETFTGQ
jgi:hypothetical protein